MQYVAEKLIYYNILLKDYIFLKDCIINTNFYIAISIKLFIKEYNDFTEGILCNTKDTMC